MNNILIVFIYIAIECPAGTVYQQCGPLCPQTCNNIGTSNCLGGCAEGCFCPDGQVWYDGSCMDVASCPGMWTINSRTFLGWLIEIPSPPNSWGFNQLLLNSCIVVCNL